MPKKVLFLDEELFVTALSRAVEDGDGRFVQAHACRLDALISKLTECLRELNALRSRARQVPAASPSERQYAADRSPEAA